MEPTRPDLADGRSARLLAFTLLTWLMVLGAALGNAATFLSPSGANKLGANALQLQRATTGSCAPRASRRDCADSAAQVQTSHRHTADGAGGTEPPLALATLAAPRHWALAPVAAPALQHEPASRAAPRRRAHLSRAPPASA